MNCQRFESVVSELARGQMMAAQQRSEALAHSRDCEYCAARLRDEETLTRGLQSLAAEMNQFDAPDKLEVEVLEAFRARKLATPVVVKQFNGRYWLAAVAALLLVAMSVVALRWRSDVETPRSEVAGVKPATLPGSDANNQAPIAEPAEVIEDQAINETPRRYERKPVRRPPVRKPESARAANDVREIATDFIPLRYLNAASLQDGGQIVRVELPRSALVNFGLPVNMDRYNEKVKADVIFGVDGLAHAIRFVQ